MEARRRSALGTEVAQKHVGDVVVKCCRRRDCAAATPPTQFGSEKVRGKVLNLLPG